MTKVNVITGFLGSGKTTTLRHLLKHKPKDEKWAILVNEFGEIGIDGTLLAEQGAVIKEIPGGCLCCVNGLPMQIGLNRLLLQNKPDRLLIEPTGLGHPKQILAVLTSEQYPSWLTLQATFCLLDARQLADPHYLHHESFRDQLAAADIIVANKQDTYTPDTHHRLQQWYQWAGDKRPLLFTEQGQLTITLLDTPSQPRGLPSSQTHQHNALKPASGIASITLPPGQKWRRSVNQGQGYFSCGWIFGCHTRFDTPLLLDWVTQLPVSRVKGVLHIKEGSLVVNRQGADLQIETRPFSPLDSRVEVIHEQLADWNLIQSQLLNARFDTSSP